MKCPKCSDQVLEERFSHGVEVDVCPDCNGVWLDRGELEKVAALGRSNEPALLASGSHTRAQDGSTETQAQPRDNDEDRPSEESTSKKPKKKKEKKQESRWERLADVLEDALDDIDFDFDFD